MLTLFIDHHQGSIAQGQSDAVLGLGT